MLLFFSFLNEALLCSRCSSHVSEMLEQQALVPHRRPSFTNFARKHLQPPHVVRRGVTVDSRLPACEPLANTIAPGPSPLVSV